MKASRDHILLAMKDSGNRTLLAIAIIGFSAYFGFTPLFNLINGGIAAAVIGAAFSVTFVIVLTMYLLNKQTEIQQESKKSEKVFEEKIKIYMRNFSRTKDILKDGKISQEERVELLVSALELQMVGSDETIKAFNSVFEEITITFQGKNDKASFLLNETEKTKIYTALLGFSQKCRMDLQLADAEITENLDLYTIEMLESAVTKRDFSKYKFNGKEYNKGELALNVIKNYVQGKNPKPSYDELNKIFPKIKGGPTNIFQEKNLVESTYEKSSDKRKRFFMKQEDAIELSDKEIRVSNQWKVDSINTFIRCCEKEGIKIEKID